MDLRLLLLPIKQKSKILSGLLFRRLFPVYSGFKDIHLIMMYHRVVESMPGGFHDPSLYVTAATFEMHIRELRRFFKIVPLGDVYPPSFPNGRTCAITFDDGWADNYHIALPIMKRYQIPSTVFLPMGKIGSNQGFWFDDLLRLANESTKNNIERKFISLFNNLVPSWKPEVLSSASLRGLLFSLKLFPANVLDELVAQCYVEMDIPHTLQATTLTWAMVSEMGESITTFGSHGMYHYILPTLDLQSKHKDIFESFEVLRHSYIPSIPWFSYPNGDWDNESIVLLRDAGYECAVTTRLGYNQADVEPLLFNRVGLHEYISHTPALLWFRFLQAALERP